MDSLVSLENFEKTSELNFYFTNIHFDYFVNKSHSCIDGGRSIMWEGVGYIDIFVLTYLENNRHLKKLITQNTNV